MIYVTFDGCSLLVLAGAHVTLENVTFKNMHRGSNRIGMVAQCAGTVAMVQGGSITGGLQGVAVQAGARLEASNLTIAEIEVLGVEVQDKGSTLKLSSCKLKDFSAEFSDHPIGLCGVRVHSSSRAHISDLCTADGCDIVSSGGHEGTCCYSEVHSVCCATGGYCYASGGYWRVL